ncbi:MULTISPECIES: FAD-binding and (Fe-S)-binding domain-containing protein [unclassified Acidovorax]|uniref:D-2-hydroxyglutarate dehydrogenase YdiJ n=1 Tax=unclassified Acidovorax TaxID=2684926 RepID=UPI001C4514A6|nr:MULTISPECIES: FAD-binding and (Fe-S)-binding domain-containing protein [unclassified Acidovorax]MBV7431672.1 FAD-binding oxidoreductase [Acidovorax sp. sif0732]MBV7452796.1 FAD-binding oxidoreductase [Acidovorax sp. sif0715]
MIAFVPPPATLASAYRDFLAQLAAQGFAGEISTRHADRTVLATDNSIYQRMPQAVVFPKGKADVDLLARLVAQESHRRIVLTPRGGGTGTNGQSLTDGIVVDLSRHMNQILHIDPVTRRVRVQAGVVKDQLNAALKPHGLFFAPELSTSNRATIGGMIATDASGQGSCTYGKTRDHVLALECVLLGGQRFESRALSSSELQGMLERQDSVASAYRAALDIADSEGALIEEKFPKLNRCLTGYDLAHLREPDGRFNLNSVICGAEGSLGFVVEAELNVLPIPHYAVLVNVRYAGFMDALRDAQALMAHKPLSIETVDSKVLLLAMQDIVWNSVSRYFPQEPSDPPTLGINLVEFSGDNPAQVNAQVQLFVEHLQGDRSVRRLGHTLASGHVQVEQVYAMRKRAVGLLGNVQGEVRPQPFVEDTAVPPEHLADYIAEFRAVLDGQGVAYGMFGHVDAGVLHVRPALDMKDPAQAALVRTISDAVVELTHKYGGLLWGEHGKGVRSEYAPRFFGPLYPALQQLKAAFDPHNQLNPGKIATPSTVPDAQLLRIDGVPMRGEADRTIDERVWKSYGTAMHCNGNGACYNFDPHDAMCPSWKATRERRHSPKGRASLMREWLRLQQAAGTDVLAEARTAPPFFTGLWSRWRNTRAQRNDGGDFSQEVYEAMSGCLACKSCAGQCPVKVSVPEFRSRFLELYHARYLRPLKDYLVGSLEFTIPLLSRVPCIYNGILAIKPIDHWLTNRAGLADSPKLSRFDLRPILKRWNVEIATPEALQTMSAAERGRSLIVVQDAFTRWFDTEVLAEFVELAARLGHRVFLAPYRPNGKPLQVQGFLQSFERTAKRNLKMLAALGRFGVPLVGLDPAMTLVYRQEYRKLPGVAEHADVLLPQEWLAQVDWPAQARTESAAASYRLLAHCTEKTTASAEAALWKPAFEKAGLNLAQQSAGCCGMSGTYGHETRNLETSRKIFDLSWGLILDHQAQPEALATGYSCRSQVFRLRDRSLRHPLQVLLQRVRAGQ